MERVPRWAWALGCGVLSAALAGCIADSGRTRFDVVPDEYPFAPASIRVYPLTHVSRAPSGPTSTGSGAGAGLPDAPASTAPMSVLVCHVEMLDAWGESTKGVGLLRLGVVRRAAGGRVVEQVDFEPLDLRDLARNYQLYDRSTRTYRVQLVELPAWVVEGLGGGGGAGSAAVRAELVVPTTDGERVLTHELVIGG